MMRILLVDDDVASATVLAGLLESEDFDVELAFDVPSALERHARAPEADLVLLDRHLGRVDALDFVDRFREVRPSTPIVLVSGDEIEAPDGIDASFTKGNDPDLLIAVIRDLVEGRPKSRTGELTLSGR